MQKINANRVTIGMFLDPSCKVRVHNTLTRDGRTILCYRLRGSKSPGVRVVDATASVNIFTRENK